MSKPKTPKPPDPVATASGQNSSNYSAANANAISGNGNITTPDGSRNTTFTPMQVYDPYTKTYNTIYQPNTTETLSPEQQAIKNQQNAANLNLSTLGANLSGQLGTKLTGNFTLGNEPTEARLMELGRKRLDPAFANRRADLQTQLSNQGIKLGSAAYDRAMGSLGQQENDAYNQLLLQGRGQATQEQLTEDNQRINQISALMSGGQVSQPNFMPAQGGNVATTDVAGIINNNYQQRLAAAQAQQAQWGGLFSALGAGAMALSDRRAKEDISKVGKTKDGQNIYSYRYKGESKAAPLRMGLMAQEVAKRKPDAVAVLPSGLMAVNYDKALRLGA